MIDTITKCTGIVVVGCLLIFSFWAACRYPQTHSYPQKTQGSGDLIRSDERLDRNWEYLGKEMDHYGRLIHTHQMKFSEGRVIRVLTEEGISICFVPDVEVEP